MYELLELEVELNGLFWFFLVNSNTDSHTVTLRHNASADRFEASEFKIGVNFLLYFCEFVNVFD